MLYMSQLHVHHIYLSLYKEAVSQNALHEVDGGFMFFLFYQVMRRCT